MFTYHGRQRGVLFCITERKTQAGVLDIVIPTSFSKCSLQLKGKPSLWQQGSALAELFTSVSHLHYFSFSKRGASSFLL